MESSLMSELLIASGRRNLSRALSYSIERIVHEYGWLEPGFAAKTHPVRATTEEDHTPPHVKRTSAER
jgi:hypothetical protein